MENMKNSPFSLKKKKTEEFQEWLLPGVSACLSPSAVSRHMQRSLQSAPDLSSLNQSDDSRM